MTRYLLRGRVLTPARSLEPGTVLVEEGRVAWVRAGEHQVSGAQLLTQPGDVVAPGFVDLQVNGFAGYDATEGAGAMERISVALTTTGVTAFMPTLISRPLAEGRAFVEAAARVRSRGARVLGAHLEGPFLSPRHAGAHDPAEMLEPTPERVAAVLAAPPRMTTIAPELPGALDAIARLRASGVLVSLGHSAASAEEAQAGFAAGARFVTHLFNAMSAFRQRQPGLPGAALLDDRPTLGLIADGEHVHPLAMQMAIRLKGPRGIALTTDQTTAAGAPPGQHLLGGEQILSDGRTVRREDGTLAGSLATMDGMVRVLAGLGCGLREVVEMATLTPARALGERSVGRIAAGLPADLVVLDAELRVRLTLVGGEVCPRD
ncbi:MAG: N-acetylglucosamine-6-phosphate deacetylase [Chloroflexi bacterium]|nr:MAG: N-acetylglucosamine-6-phosphate deacetylase [Chloroflexota bacterium]